MERRNTLGTALVVLALVLFAVPAIFPIQPMLFHDTDRTAHEPPEQLKQENVEIIAYENMSNRGQEYYRKALENDGEYSVPVDQGAPEFDYLNRTERRRAYETNNESALRAVVIERPKDDSDLPPADERSVRPDPDENVSDDEREARQQAIERYDLIETQTSEPPLGATAQLMRLASVLFAVLSLGVGGYLLSSN